MRDGAVGDDACRASQLAIEMGEMHRVVVDLDKAGLRRRGLSGARRRSQRDEKLRVDKDEKKRALERGKNRLLGLPMRTLRIGDPGRRTMRRETADLAGHRIATTARAPRRTTRSAATRPRQRADPRSSSATTRAIKFKEIWVQHNGTTARPRARSRSTSSRTGSVAEGRSSSSPTAAIVFSVPVLGLGRARRAQRRRPEADRQRSHAAQTRWATKKDAEARRDQTRAEAQWFTATRVKRLYAARGHGRASRCSASRSSADEELDRRQHLQSSEAALT